MMAKETQRASGTHVLERVEGGTSQDGERNGESKEHLRTGERGEKVKSEWQKKWNK
jgi:hypothetical protein